MTSTKRACAAARDVPSHAATAAARPPAPRPARAAAGAAERALRRPNASTVLAVLRSAPSSCDKAPAQVWARLLDDGHLPVLDLHHVPAAAPASGRAGERRRQAHPSGAQEARADRAPAEPGVVLGHHQAARPATRRLLRPVRDASTSSPATSSAGPSPPPRPRELAKAFIADAIATHGIARDQLALHADRGTSMTSKPVAQLLVDLGVARSHSPPPRVQRQPLQRGAVQDPQVLPGLPRPVRLDRRRPRVLRARSSTYYNHEHRHSGIGLHTPASVHYGTATEIRAQRAADPRRRLRRQPRPIPQSRPHRGCPGRWINEPPNGTRTQIQNKQPACLIRFDSFRAAEWLATRHGENHLFLQEDGAVGQATPV